VQSVDPLETASRVSKTQRIGRSESLLIPVAPGGGWGQVWLDFRRCTPSPNVRMLRRTMQLCRATCSNCRAVQRWTKILEFLYYGCETVINLSGEGPLEMLGSGYGGVLRLQDDPVCERYAASLNSPLDAVLKNCYSVLPLSF